MKLTTIGGGSSYTPELAEGIIKKNKTLNVKEWWLFDISESKEKLETVGNLIKRMFLKNNIETKVVLSYDLKESIMNADFVTTQTRVGLMKSRYYDELVPLNFGMLGQETNGFGGVFNALRTIPVILEIVDLVEKYAKKNAWIINFSNPSGTVTEAIKNLRNFNRFIGVCNISIHTKIQLSDLLKIDINKFQMDVVGLNHLIYFTNFYYNGKSIKNEVLKKSKNEDFIKRMTMKNIEELGWNPNLIDGLNALPCPYHRYFYKSKTMLDKYLKDLKQEKLRSQVVQKLEHDLFQKYNDKKLNKKPKELSERGGAFYSDVAVGVIESIWNDFGNEFTVNTINDDKVSNMPRDWVVETTCRLTKKGPVKINREILLPEAAMGMIHSIKQYELHLIKAIKNKSKKDALFSCLINPFVTDDIVGEKIFDKLFKLNKKYISYLK